MPAQAGTAPPEYLDDLAGAATGGAELLAQELRAAIAVNEAELARLRPSGPA